jgi:hypothetical protein
MRKRTAEETARAELSTPLGFFNFAASYRSAADKLRICKLRATHPHSPILFIYYHAIELYLKAFLRSEGFTVAELEDIGHKFSKLQKLCADRGLHFDDEDKEVLAMMATPGAWSGTRYLQVGVEQRPSLTALRRTCRSLDASVFAALSARGIRIRRMTRSVRVTD